MSRRHFTFACGGETLAETLAGTLDAADGEVGLLIVTGGNETRAGAFGGQAQLAARIADAGYPVLRFDRRGVGDSTGENGGFRESAHDIRAALAALRAEQPQLRRIVAFGNCDAASALMLSGGGGCDGLLLANPWTFDDQREDEAALAPPGAIRSRYASKLKNPREVWRLLTGKVSITKLARGLTKALHLQSNRTDLSRQMSEGIDWFGKDDFCFLIAANDRTGQAFLSTWESDKSRTEICPNAGHSFAEAHAREWLFEQLLSALQEQAGQLNMG